jgi:hypothetical protein
MSLMKTIPLRVRIQPRAMALFSRTGFSLSGLVAARSIAYGRTPTG